MNQPATNLDFQRLTQRINEIAEENNKIIEDLTTAYKERIKQFSEEKKETEKMKTKDYSYSIESVIEHISKIDEVFASIEKRQDDREEARFKRLKQLEDESIEMSKQMKDLAETTPPS